MPNKIEIIVWGSIFVMLLVVMFKPVQSAFNLSTFLSCVFSMCVSALCVIGMSRSLKGISGIVLMPYAALGITVLLMLLLPFIGKHFKGAKDRLSEDIIHKDDTAQANNERLKR